MTAPNPLALYKPVIPMWEHQQREFLRSAEAPAWFLSMEPRTGKTKVIIDTTAYLHSRGLVDALIVVAMPSGVHVNWLTDELPIHMPVGTPYKAIVWSAQKCARKSFQQQAQDVLETKDLAVVLINGEAILTKAFRFYIKKFMTKRKCILVGDETTLIMKTPGSKRNRIMQGMAKLAKYRRCLDGTPVGEGPLDLYTQYKFLDPRILGYTSYYAYRNQYAEMEKGYNHNTKREYITVTGYKNLDELNAKIAPYTSRVLRKDVFDAPDKVYSKHQFELTLEQRRVYTQLRDEYETELRDGHMLTAVHVLTRLLRLQQVTSNFWPAQTTATLCEACEGEGCERCNGLGAFEKVTPAKAIDKTNARLNALHEQLNFEKEPVIIWARFRDDHKQILKLCEQIGRKAVYYDGNDAAKYEARTQFQQDRADTLVANQSTAGRGLKLTKARTIIYYSNNFSLLTRIQSEDRAEEKERKFSTNIVDLIANDTVDMDIVGALRRKKKITDVVLKEKETPFI